MIETVNQNTERLLGHGDVSVFCCARNEWGPPERKVDTRKYRAEPKSIFEYEPGKSSILEHERPVSIVKTALSFITYSDFFHIMIFFFFNCLLHFSF